MAVLKRAFEVAVNVGIVSLFVVVLVHPRSLVRITIADFLHRRHEAAVLREAWPEMTAVGARFGSAAPERTIVEFADYQCPACRQVFRDVETLVAREQHVQVVFRHFPITRIHPHAEAAALASICAEEQDAFPELHRFLFTDTTWASTPSLDWLEVAARAGVSDPPSLVSCMGAADTRTRLDRDVDLAMHIGVRATPTFFPEGEAPIVGAATLEVLERSVALPTRRQP